ncbi:MAG: hypothetical protein P8M72_02905 [Gammaproteobacteria bacterium]|nr:hypothetical protein [Gammaproteobacteria bacterium]
MGLRNFGVIILGVFVLVACSQQEQPSQISEIQNQAEPDPQTAIPTLDDRPNLNGVWKALNTAHWNLEAHSAQALDDFWQMGAIAAIPAGKSVLKDGGSIPYLPDALAQRDTNRDNWPQEDPEAKCFMLGIPRATYHEIPFQIFQGGQDDDLFMVYPFAASQRVIHLEETTGLPLDAWMGKSNGVWEGDSLVVTTLNQNGMTWLDRAGNHYSNQLVVTERFTLLSADHIWYEATMEDPQTFSEAWTIEMPLYRLIEDNAQTYEHKCVPFADNLLYWDLLGLDDPAQ